MPRPNGIPGLLRERPLPIAVAISALLSAVYLLWQPQTLDLAAQTFRADLFERDGWVIWSPAWYGGFTIPGYSLLYPPLGAWLGPATVGALSAVAAAALFALVAVRAFGERAWLGVVWFGLASAAAIYGGRITFALGLAIGLAAVLAIQRDRRLLAALAGAGAAAASPVAGLFTLLAAASVVATALWRRRQSAAGAELPAAAALAAAVGTGLALAALAVALPTDGYQPFVFSAFVPIPLAVAALWLLAPPEDDLLRAGALLYLAVALIALAVETPLGGNVVRLGVTFAGPLLAIAALRRRPLVLALVAIPLLYWQWTATVRDVAAAEGDPSTEAAYYEPLLAELDEFGAGAVDRVHIPATRNRWESVYIAERLPIDGGWLRQLETDDGLVTSDGAEAYLQSLRERGVTLLAVNDAEADHSAEAERRLLDDPAFPLQPLQAGEHWRLYGIDPGPGRDLAIVLDGDAELGGLRSDGFEVELGKEGSALLALRYTPYFEADGSACVGEEGSGTRISGEPGETVEVRARFSVDAALGRERSCG